ncbi:MAG: hypothetical protein LBD77_06530 [Bifidobacteriaceae bacterium]|jgi:hypothetical protein|nr:hypothetical protein [Bifidobacteriaceae bacterium]
MVEATIGEVVEAARRAMAPLGHSVSTMRRYEFAWRQVSAEFDDGCLAVFDRGRVERFVERSAAGLASGDVNLRKHRLLRKAALVLVEVAETGGYKWAVSRRAHVNGGLVPVFRAVQEEFEAWLGKAGLAKRTRELYAVVSRRVLGWLPERGVAAAGELTRCDVSAAVAFLSVFYQPGSMGAALTGLRCLCRFLDETGRCPGLVGAVPGFSARRRVAPGVLGRDAVGAGRIPGFVDTGGDKGPGGASSGFQVGSAAVGHRRFEVVGH